MTARWVVEEVKPNRDLQVEWEPISLMFKNDPQEGSDRHQKTYRTHGMLRVMESVRTELGNEGVFRAYWAFGTHIHHDKKLFGFEVADVLTRNDIDARHAEAFEDQSWDEEIRRRMNAGLTLVGDDVGTPIISMEDSSGVQVGMFGPVITQVPGTEESLRLWDGLVAVSTVPGFWELKRTRTEDPRFGNRPTWVPSL
ncbi:MAG: disulfide bond formation protein DsbA [bacterium]|nr:disulfide bond formation protein DsbA [bacterium]MXX65067.1 disulfide bond formation protein DsbA [Acidimicrobiia bacterium]MCY3579371.1 disulfide bond formation protein DsbA [bacterium]MCY3652322.1 disulfide bond formation protein DsbA [bacterium]MDE0643134.1 disulfide bond formation protein DsbA [bacterium]